MHYQKQRKKRRGRSRLKKPLPFANQQHHLGYENSIPHGNIHDEKSGVKQNVSKAKKWVECTRGIKIKTSASVTPKRHNDSL